MNANMFKDAIERKGFFRFYLEEVIGGLGKLRQHSPGSKSS